MRNLFAIFLFYVSIIYISHCEKIEELSFEPPFNDVDHSGERIISREWRVAGSTAVSSSFVRLTPDRQSKRGAIWSRRSIDSNAISAILKFRISGQGKTFFGDGLAFWVTTSGYYLEGDLHGFDEKFTGIAIIFDTFKNAETIHAHRDVTILVNDGEKTTEMMMEKVEGCNINVRYHAERADFNVKDSISRAKFILEEQSLDLFVDARNSGEWTRCAKVERLELPEGWLEHAHIGVTATTGQLADNHDVISLQTYTEPMSMERDIQHSRILKFYTPKFNDTQELRLLRVENTLDTILSQLDFMDTHGEHEFMTMQDALDNLKTKIENIEPKESENVKEIVDKATVDLSSQLKQYRVQIGAMEDKLKKIERMAGAASGGWRTPFFILLLVLLSVAGAGYYWYRKNYKSWKLP